MQVTLRSELIILKPGAPLLMLAVRMEPGKDVESPLKTLGEKVSTSHPVFCCALCVLALQSSLSVCPSLGASLVAWRRGHTGQARVPSRL